MNYYLKVISKIRGEIDLNRSKSVYDKKRWKRKKLNCYSYALDILVEDPKKQIWFPGCICDEYESKDIYSDIVGRLKKDLDFLGISYRDNNDDLKQDEWRIAIYYIPTPHDFPIGFHISRQEDDGTWSEKPSWKDPVRKIGEKSNTPPDLKEKRIYLDSVLIISKINR